MRCYITGVLAVILAIVTWQSVHVVVEFESKPYSSPHSSTAISHRQKGNVEGWPLPTFCNFDGHVCCHTSVETQFPGTVAEVQEVVRDAVRRRSRVRVSGAGHSMSSLVCDPQSSRTSSNDVSKDPLTILSLDRMQRVLAIHRVELTDDLSFGGRRLPLETTTAHVTVEAGLRLIELNRALRHMGLGLKNMGLIQEQSVAGLMATGVHGTGNRLTSIPTIVQSMDVVLANGSLVTWNRASNPEMFRHARLHLGLFGVVVHATIAVTDLYDLQRHNAVTTLEDVLTNMDANQRGFRHYQFWWVPGTQYALENAMDMVEVPVATLNEGPPMCDVYRQQRDIGVSKSLGLRPCKFVTRDADGNTVPLESPRELTPLYRALSTFKTDMTFDIAVRLSRVLPSIGPLVLRLLPYLEPVSQHLVGWAPDVLTFPGINFHAVRYTELEYFVPMKAATNAIRWFVTFAAEHSADCPINSIDPIRTVMGDDVPLSPLAGWHESGGGIAVSFVLVQRDDIFTQCASIVEDAMLTMGGRPHWGKRHPLVRTYNDVVALFDSRMVDAYRSAVSDADPSGVFQTEELKSLLRLETK
jgi:L-gulono-1,4-lactone dehydrogenase